MLKCRLQEVILQVFITESNFTSIAWLSGTPVFPSELFSSSRCGKAMSFHGVIFWKASSAGAMGAREKKQMSKSVRRDTMEAYMEVDS